MALSDQQIGEIDDQLRAGRKIAAIKLYRDWTGASLVSAKNFVEQLQSGQAGPTEEDGLAVDQIDRVLDAIQRGHKIEAIKEYRERSGCSLKESRAFIERLMEQLEIEEPGSTRQAGCGSAVVLLVGLAASVAIAMT